jgi:hypothetical protein
MLADDSQSGFLEVLSGLIASAGDEEVVGQSRIQRHTSSVGSMKLI